MTGLGGSTCLLVIVTPQFKCKVKGGPPLSQGIRQCLGLSHLLGVRRGYWHLVGRGQGI